MLFTFHREPVVDMPLLAHEVEEGAPRFLAFLAVKEGLIISNQDQAVSCAGQQDVKPLWRLHETNVTFAIRASQRDDDNVTFLSLVIVCNMISL